MIDSQKLYTTIWLFALLLSISSHESLGQSGSLFIANHSPADHSFDNYNYDVLENEKGLILMANRRGLLSFDGKSWDLTETPYALFFIEEANDGTIYAGGRSGFGKFIIGEDFELEFEPIDSTYRDLFNSYIQGEFLYMINEQKLLIHDIKTGKTMFIQGKDGAEYEELNGDDSTVWVSTSDKGILEIEDYKLKEPSRQPISGSHVKRTNKSGVSVHFAFSGETYLETELGFEPLKLNDDGWLDNKTITQLEWINTNILAISTLSDGVLFADITTGDIVGISNYETGLPDEELMSMNVDRSGSLWLTHARGVSIISPLLPVTTFSTFPGLSGDLLQIAHFENKIYVASSTGIYVLQPKPTYAEEVVMVEQVVQEDTTRRRGQFGRRRKRKTQEQTTMVEKTIKRLVSMDYEFQRVDGIEAKSTQLLEFNNQLFAGTQEGAFYIYGQEATKILDQPIQHLFGDEVSGLLFVSLSDETTKVLKHEGGTWKENKLLEGLSDLVGQIVADDDGALWLCGTDSVYRIELEDKSLNDVEVYKINNPYYENLHATEIGNQLVFTNTSGYYTFDGDSIVRSEQLESWHGLPSGFLLTPRGELWIQTVAGWVGQRNGEDQDLNFLSIVPDPQALEIQNDSIFWVITARNELYRVNGKQFSLFQNKRKLFLKEARTSRRRLKSKDISITQDEGEISFEFVRPDYMEIYGTVYQYRLKGLSADWSNWSSMNNIITYPFLPPNSYTLELRTRDALGNIEMAQPIRFKVQAPYWRRPWFYALEMCFFGGLLYFSFRLNRKTERYTVLSRLLSFMTLILIVEFFQTIAESRFETDESPVIDFFIQAFIALLILPIESLIRRFISGSDKGLGPIKLPVKPPDKKA